MRIGDWKLIHYFEDGRNELYNLATDPGEEIDVAHGFPVRTAQMWKQLDEYLTSVKANRPTPDPRYDAAKTEAKFARQHTELKAKLERTHQEVLQPDWKPNKDWYGSMITKD